MRDTSPQMIANLNALCAQEPLITCLEITHPQLDGAVFVCDDIVDLEAFGNTYIACPFDYKEPGDTDERTPMGTLEIDNIGGYAIEADGQSKTLSEWIDTVNGGREVKLTIFQTIKSEPLKEHIITVDCNQVSINAEKVSMQIGFIDPSKRPAVARNFDPERAPGVF